MIDGSIVRVQLDSAIDTSGVWGDPYAGTERHFLSTHALAGPFVSLLAGPTGTTVVETVWGGATRDSVAHVEGHATGPAAHGDAYAFATDLGRLVIARPTGVVQEMEVGTAPSSPVWYAYWTVENKPGDYFVTAEVAVLLENALAIGQTWPERALPRLIAASPSPVTGAPGLADIDADGRPEILFGTQNGCMQAFSLTGASFTGWPVRLDGGSRSDPSDAPIGSPAARDLDGDGQMDIVFATRHGSVVVASGNGRIAPDSRSRLQAPHATA